MIFVHTMYDLQENEKIKKLRKTEMIWQTRVLCYAIYQNTNVLTDK